MTTYVHPEAEDNPLAEFASLVRNKCDPDKIQSIMKMSQEEVLQRFRDIKDGKVQTMSPDFTNRLEKLFEEGRKEADLDLVPVDEESKAYEAQIAKLSTPTDLDFEIAETTMRHQDKLFKHIQTERSELERVVNMHEGNIDREDEAAGRNADAKAFEKWKARLKETPTTGPTDGANSQDNMPRPRPGYFPDPSNN